jgi:hypothetical protein
VPRLLIPGVKIHFILTKAKDGFYLINTERASISTFKFLEAKINIRRVRPNPDVLTGHQLALSKGGMIRFYFTRDELRTGIFDKGTKSLTLDTTKL